MIIGIEGDLGTGKTIMMVRYLHKDFINLKHRIMSNMQGLQFGEIINIPEIMQFDKKTKTKDIDVKKMPNLNNVSIGIDEITVFMDCRRSMSKMNLLLSYFILQTRKRNVHLYYTTQDTDMVDNRLFKYTNMFVFCEYIYDEEGDVIDDWRNYFIVDRRKKRKWQTSSFNMNISKYYDLYDTKEVILPPI